jgi:tetratricopeptide (TPR) repeat protein
MGKKRRHAGRLERADAGEGQRGQVFVEAKAAPSSRWRQPWFKVLLAVIAPILCFLVLEAALRLIGFGHSTRFFVRWDDHHLVPNRRFSARFMHPQNATQAQPVLLETPKPVGRLRVFVIGESAAQGTPDPAFGFARILESMIQTRHPARQVEVVNVAMRGINSHVLRLIARECARLQPDLCMVYAGNNEVVGLHSPSPGTFNLTPYRRLLQFLQAAKTTRCGQAVDAIARSLRKGGKPTQDMEYFRSQRMSIDDPERLPVYANFRANLEDMCASLTSSGAPLLLCTVGVNLKDFPPLASLHKPGLKPEELTRWNEAWSQGTNAEATGASDKALAHYQAAAGADPSYAELQFRLGRLLLQQGQTDQAVAAYRKALDQDALQFRADQRINTIIREVAAAWQSRKVILVDFEKRLSELPVSDHGLAGRFHFYEHVHLTFEGDHALAAALLPQVELALDLVPSGRPEANDLAAVPTRQACAEAIAFSPVDEMNVWAAMVRSTTRPPFLDQLDHASRQADAEERQRQRVVQTQQQGEVKRSVEIYRAAVAKRPRDWQTRFSFGMLLNSIGDKRGAREQLGQCVDLMSAFLPARIALAQACWDLGSRVEARTQINEALKIDPKYEPALQAFGSAGQGR